MDKLGLTTENGISFFLEKVDRGSIIVGYSLYVEDSNGVKLSQTHLEKDECLMLSSFLEQITK